MLLTNAAGILGVMLVAQVAPLSVSDLLGNADRFHGQPVTVTGTMSNFRANRLRRAGPLQDLTRFAYLVGWRRGEVPTLERTEVDYQGRRLRLRGAESKNGEPRYLPYGDSPTLVEIIERRWQARTLTGGGARFVFHRNGKRIRDFRTAWEGATERAGCPDLLFHDLRRSAVNNLNAVNMPPKVAMQITGHKTMTTYQRYHIVRDDTRAALSKVDAAVKATRSMTPEPPATAA